MKSTIVSIIVAVALVGGALMLTSRDVPTTPVAGDFRQNVSLADGKQLVTIDAKGGYAPRETVAKAGFPTTIVVKTRGTFDCSSALVIPALGYRANLPPTGETRVEVPPQPAGTTLQGICAMGMYSFSVSFQ